MSGQGTRERIVTSSAELFRRQGYTGTGMKQIVAEARAPFGSLYHFFPGDSSWATEIDNRDDLELWLQRFVATGLKIYPDEVIAQGPPWNTTLCVRGTDHLDTEDGRVYENRYVIWGRMSWGLLREYEVYEDTQASKRLDEYLSRRGGVSTGP